MRVHIIRQDRIISRLDECIFSRNISIILESVVESSACKRSVKNNNDSDFAFYKNIVSD